MVGIVRLLFRHMMVLQYGTHLGTAGKNLPRERNSRGGESGFFMFLSPEKAPAAGR